MPERNPPDTSMVLATDIVFRPMLQTDIDVGLQLCRLAGWDQTRRDWERFVAADHGTAHVALHEGRVVGTVATIRFGREFGWIGMVLVHPDVQGRGVGPYSSVTQRPNSQTLVQSVSTPRRPGTVFIRSMASSMNTP